MLLIRLSKLFFIFIYELIVTVLSHCLYSPCDPFYLKIIKLFPKICEKSGGVFPKLGQILSTRVDILSSDICNELEYLQDNVQPLPLAIVRKILSNYEHHSLIKDIDLNPIACATISQVHYGVRLDNGKEIALKIIRPNIAKELEMDCHIIMLIGKFISFFPAIRNIPINKALCEVSHVLISQADFSNEALNHEKLYSLFQDNKDVIVPKIHSDLCTSEIIVMDFIPGLQKLSDQALPEYIAREALSYGVHALYYMIFSEGFIHCDMHPGNVLVVPSGQLVILDAGFMTQLDNATRQKFAKFFLSIAFRDGITAARIVRETAEYLPPKLNLKSFEDDITSLIEKVGGLQARDFQVAGFVGELFAIQRKHGIYGTNLFTLAILSLLVFEGVTKQRFPDLDFQKEAVPFVLSSLQDTQPNKVPS